MGRARSLTTAVTVSTPRGRSRRGQIAEVTVRLGQLRPPKEFIKFISSFDGYYRDHETNAAEIVGAIPDGTDLLLALDKTALWLLSDKEHGVAGLIPRNSPNQTTLRALKRLYTRRINGEYIDEEAFEKVGLRFIYDTTINDDYELYKEMTGRTPPKYKAGAAEQAAVTASQLVLADYDHQVRLADAMSWISHGEDSSEDGLDETPESRAAYQALIDAFKTIVAA